MRLNKEAVNLAMSRKCYGQKELAKAGFSVLAREKIKDLLFFNAAMEGKDKSFAALKDLDQEQAEKLK